MSILVIGLVIIVVGVLLWAALKYIPMEPTIRRLLVIVVVALLVIWVLQELGIWQVILGAKI